MRRRIRIHRLEHNILRPVMLCKDLRIPALKRRLLHIFFHVLTRDLISRLLLLRIQCSHPVVRLVQFLFLLLSEGQIVIALPSHRIDLTQFRIQIGVIPVRPDFLFLCLCK